MAGARELLSELAAAGLTVTTDGASLTIKPASKLTEAMRARLIEAKPELLALLRPIDEFDDTGDVRFAARVDRLRRWGWPATAAHAMAERLAQRDCEGDYRACCLDCRNFRPGRCGQFRRAGLVAPDVGRELAALPQHCPAFDRL